MSRPQTIYFLGAGASKDAGAPLTSSLLQMILDRLQTRDRKNLRRFIETFGFDIPARFASSRPMIVEAISLLDASIRDGQPLDRFFNLERLNEVRIQLGIELAHIIKNRPKYGALVQVEHGKKYDVPPGLRVPTYYRKFVNSFMEPGQYESQTKHGDAIITTNYDINSDIALYEIVYGDQTGKFNDVWLGAEFRDPWTDKPALSKPTSPREKFRILTLLKLHGSLNWLYCARCSRIYVRAFAPSVGLIVNGDPWEKTCWCGYRDLEPVLVAPSVLQEIKNPQLKRIWMNAYHYLENAERWVFVGYSLPSEDLAVRSLLHRACDGCKERNRRFPMIEVICPDTGEEGKRLKVRYERFFKQGVRFKNIGFAEYVRRAGIS